MDGDPKLFYQAHVFVCTNERPAGHPRGCCKDKGSEKLRDYMKARAKELGLRPLARLAGYAVAGVRVR